MNKQKLYHIDITIHNGMGELLDKRFSFDDIHALNAFMTDSMKMHNVWDEAHDNGKKDGILYEELEDELGRDHKEIDTYDGSSREDLINSDEVFN